MKNILNFLLNFLFPQGPQFSTGALESPEDKRNINVASFQQPITLPDDFETPMPYVRDQGPKPKCVASAISTLAEYYQTKKGVSVKLSDDDLYTQCKLADGIPNTPGTYPSVAANIAFKQGICSEQYVNSLNQDRAKYKFGGYAFVSADFESITQAIYQNGAITASVQVDQNWFKGIITKVLQSLGRHYIILNGANIPSQILKGQNSWGINWIGKILGILNPSIKPGNFQVAWKDIEGTLIDIIAFADIPAPILDVVKAKPYYFTRTLKRGDKGQDVLELQKRLDKEGFWQKSIPMSPVYGPSTAYSVLCYQKTNHIIFDPNESEFGNLCGPKTIRSLNGEVKLSLEEAIIQQESNGNLYVIGDKNLKDKAYGCMQIRQPVCTDVNMEYKTNYKPQDTLGNKDLSIEIFRKYIDLYVQGGNDEAKARLWNGGPNWRNVSATVEYWNEVQQKMV